MRNHLLFRKDERQFYTNVNESKSRTGKVPNINEFVAFWGGIWEDEKVTPSYHGWMKSQES